MNDKISNANSRTLICSEIPDVSVFAQFTKTRRYEVNQSTKSF